MTPTRTRLSLVVLALALSGAGAALGHRGAPPAKAPQLAAVATVDAFALAKILAESPPDTVVLALDGAKHPLRGALPSALLGADDAVVVERAPKARRIIVAAADPARAEKLARALGATGRRAAVLRGGIAAWDAAMDADPPAPAPTANEAAWKEHRSSVALRRSFGDASAAPATPVAAPVAPVAAPGGGGAKKREGC
jgi:hypothetical protein